MFYNLNLIQGTYIEVKMTKYRNATCKRKGEIVHVSIMKSDKRKEFKGQDQR